MFKGKKFSSIGDARNAAKKTANELECNVPIYLSYTVPTVYHLWHGNELIEWVKPVIEDDDGY